MAQPGRHTGRNIRPGLFRILCTAFAHHGYNDVEKETMAAIKA